MLTLAGCAIARTFGFNNDGKTDIIWRNTATDQNLFWWMKEAHWFGGFLLEPEQTKAAAPKGSTCGPVCWKIVATADFDRDASTDLLWRDQSSGQNQMWFMQNANKISEGALPNADRDYYVVGAGDFNGDGYPDILWRSDIVDQTVVWYMTGTNLLTAELIVPSAAGRVWHAAAVGDFNNDGNPDILWQDQTDRRLTIWYMKGKTLVSAKALMLGGKSLYPAEPGWVVAGTGSFNQVGNTDILWRRTDGQVALWLMQGDTFARPLWLPSMPYPDWQIGGTGGYLTEYNQPLSMHGCEIIANVEDGKIALQWRLGDARRPNIYRRVAGSTNWGPKAVEVLPSRWTDPDIPPVGARWEYKLASVPAMFSEMIVSTVKAPPVHQRGTVILVVERGVAGALTNELESLTRNLVGDGWKVRRVAPDVERHDDTNWAANPSRIVALKRAITNLYTANPDAKAVLLIGHVPIPHAGGLSHNPDGHGTRSLPADTYYGDVDGLWTDSTIDRACFLMCNPPPGDCSCGVCAGARHENHPGDGIWDQSNVPPNPDGIARLELAVGRIDFANMPNSVQPLFPGKNYEIEALRRYLIKDDRYRRKLITLQQRVMTGTYFQSHDQWQQVLSSGLRLGSRLFGFAPENIINGDGFYRQNGCTWTVNGGFGQPYHIQGSNYVFHATYTAMSGDVSFLTPGAEPQTGFYSLYGSCFVDYAYADNLLRAILAAGTDYNLGAMWFSTDVPLHFEELALGDTVGAGFLHTVSEDPSTFLAWMGDPTLRLQIVAPPGPITADREGREINLAWNASSEASRYFVYRSTQGLEGAWTLLTTNAISTPSFTDEAAPHRVGISYLYQVRAASLTTTASGSFTNLSQGVFSAKVK